MITTQRKSKYKHKVMFTDDNTTRQNEVREWCEQNFGPGGRRNRWRFGWTDRIDTYYFKDGKDAMVFTLKWSS